MQESVSLSKTMTVPVLITNALRICFVAALVSVAVLLPSDLRASTAAVDLLVGKARSLEARDRIDLAAQVWQQVLVADPNQPEALASLARWAKHSGKNAEANAYRAKLVATSPDSSALKSLESADAERKSSSRLDQAAKLAAGQHFEEAMQIYREVFGPNPPAGGWSIAYYQTMGKTAGGFEPAVAALKQLAKTYPDVPDYTIAAGTLMTDRPSTREAGIKLLSSVEGSSSAATKAKSAWRQALLWEKSNAAYLPEFSAYLSRYPDAELQSIAAAMPALASSKAVLPLPGSHEEQLGYEALKKGNLAEAEQQFNRALERNSGSWRAHAGLGFVSMKASNFDEAVGQLDLAHKSAPGDAAVRNALTTAKFWQAMHTGAQQADKQDWSAAGSSYQAALSIRPNDAGALRALGEAILAGGSPQAAIPVLVKATHAQSSDISSWCSLAEAKLQAEGGRATLAMMKQVPPSLASGLEGSIAWKGTQASAYAEAGDEAQALKIYRELASIENRDLKQDERLAMASLALRFRQYGQAISFAQRAVETEPRHSGPWEVLLGALIAAGRNQDARRVYARMPQEVQQTALTHPGFQQTLASLKENSGDLEGARVLLEQVLNASTHAGTDESQLGAKMQLAGVLAKLGQPEEAETMMSALADARPDDPNVWRSYFSVLQQLHRSNDIVTAAARMPQPVALRLGSEGGIVTLLANAQSASGNKEVAMRLLETYVARTDIPNSAGALPQRIQLAWMLLESPRNGGRLYSLLDELNGRSDLNSEQRQEISTLWTTWVLRTAELAQKSGNEARSLALLDAGIKMFPTDANLERALAGALLRTGNTKRALNVYANWGLAGAHVDDYAGAIGAAMTEHKYAYADTWIQHGLAQWPRQSKLLQLAGDRAQSQGDLKKAEALWKQALTAKRAQADASAPLEAESPREPSLKMLLAGSDTAPDAPVRVRDRRVLPSQEDGTLQLQLSSFRPNNTTDNDINASGDAGAEPLALPFAADASYVAKAVLPAAEPADSLEDKIAGIESRNSPYLSSRMAVWARGGESGFSRLVIQQEQFEASTTLSNQLKASILLLPTYLSAGSANGSGDALFGTQSTPAGFGPQNASGVAAEAQLSSQSMGLRVGTTPQGFLTHNWIGGFRLQPKHGPITFMLERDSVKDSMLAYAGARDPQSGQIWGGVMANTASLQGRWGDAKSGLYANTSYQVIEGRNVARNTAFSGNAGAWWKLASNTSGDLTVGVNFSAMHYDRNLRYFTLGQGGYFSPQQYMLFSVPVRWTGKYGNRLQYTLGGSLGSQHFTEDSSDYYPTDAALQAKTNLRYQPYANTGANFSLDARLGYQLAPHWMLGAFATANNARNYTASAAGIFVKYTFEERPMNIDGAVPSVPDWRGQQGFSMF